MAGNVWEWCVDWYDEKHNQRVIRGGSWDDVPEGVRTSVRFRSLADGQNLNLGFRLVQDIP
jgi:formylglycine-generating enzyme required for sulfatase activity